MRMSIADYLIALLKILMLVKNINLSQSPHYEILIIIFNLVINNPL